MRIAFDVSPLSHEPTGVNNYIRGSLAGLAEVASRRGHEVVAFAPTSPAGKRVIPEALAGIDVKTKLVALPGAHGWRTAWSVAGYPPAERFVGKFDVLHFSDWMYPPQKRGVRATTIHDLVPVHHPEWTTRRTRAMHSRKYRNAALTCDVVFANSDYTADDFARTFEFPRERVFVAYPGIGETYSADGPAEDLGAPYLLTVATLEPRKNLGTLVDAFSLLDDADLSLVVVGGKGWGEQPQLDRRGIVRLGRVSDDHLARLYRGADAVVYPSRFEGFGMPITEAMASGAAVVASWHPSMDEASGDAAVRADPESPQAIADAIDDARTRHDELRAKGLAHARRFSWRRTGEIFLEGYERFA
jgi:glycosyltransferase involved in cell wall biosynthesis